MGGRRTRSLATVRLAGCARVSCASGSARLDVGRDEHTVDGAVRVDDEVLGRCGAGVEARRSELAAVEVDADSSDALGAESWPATEHRHPGPPRSPGTAATASRCTTPVALALAVGHHDRRGPAAGSCRRRSRRHGVSLRHEHRRPHQRPTVALEAAPCIACAPAGTGSASTQMKTASSSPQTSQTTSVLAEQQSAARAQQATSAAKPRPVQPATTVPTCSRPDAPRRRRASSRPPSSGRAGTRLKSPDDQVGDRQLPGDEARRRCPSGDREVGQPSATAADQQRRERTDDGDHEVDPRAPRSPPPSSVTPPSRWIVIDRTCSPNRWAITAWAISWARTESPSSTANESARRPGPRRLDRAATARRRARRPTR